MVEYKDENGNKVTIETVRFTELLSLSINDSKSILYTYSITHNTSLPVSDDVKNKIVELTNIYDKLYTIVNKLMVKRNDIYKLILYISKHFKNNLPVTINITDSEASLIITDHDRSIINIRQIKIENNKIILDGFKTPENINDMELLELADYLREHKEYNYIIAAIKYLQNKNYL